MNRFSRFLSKQTSFTIVSLSVLSLLLWKFHSGNVNHFQIRQTQDAEHVPKEQQTWIALESVGPDDPQDPRFYNIILEKEALLFERCSDTKSTVSTKNSRVQLQDGPSRMYLVGEDIRAIVTLYDWYGKRKYTGGDQLRATIENTTLAAATPCTVTDNRDGTHEVVCRALWTGMSTIIVTLAYTRETITSLYRIRNEILATKTIYGLFKSRTYTEGTVCHPNSAHLLRLSNYTELCNLTYLNSGMQFYCGKPQDVHLLCQDWQKVRSLEPFPELPVSECEAKLLKIGQRNLEQELQIHISDNRRKKIPVVIGRPSITCFNYNVSRLWYSRKPSGFFYDGTWHLLNCRGTKESSFIQCLRNRRVYLFGDSTIRAWYKAIIGRFQCKPITEQWLKEKWHKEAECYNKHNNFYAGWYPHSQPFFVGNNWDDVRYTQFSVARRIDNIPSNTKAIIVIHLYLHMLAFHHNVFKERMMIIRKSVENLLSRSNQSVVMIKGPHTYEGTSARGIRLTDYHGYVYSKILFDVFSGLHDRVVLLNNRDTTLAQHVKWNHPHQHIVNAMIDQMLSYTCK